MKCIKVEVYLGNLTPGHFNTPKFFQLISKIRPIFAHFEQELSFLGQSQRI